MLLAASLDGFHVLCTIFNLFKEYRPMKCWESLSIGGMELMNITNVILTKHNRILTEFIRYVFVGGLAFLLDFSTLYLLTSIFNVYYLTSAAIGFVLGLTCNYILSVRWVFSSRTIAKPYLEYGIFALIGIVGLSLNELVIWLLTDFAGLHYISSKIVATAVVFFWNFLGRKLMLFR